MSDAQVVPAPAQASASSSSPPDREWDPAGPALDEESSRVEVTDEYWARAMEGLKRCQVVKIGSRAEDNGTTHVSLRSSDLDELRITELCMAPMVKCDSLTYIDLSDVHLSIGAVRALRQAILVTQSPVEYLALRHNRMTDDMGRVLLIDDVDPLKMTFRGGSRLATIDLSHNQLTDLLAATLASALPSQHSVRLLDLSENHFSERAQELLSKATDAAEIVVHTTWKDRGVCVRVCGQNQRMCF